jgi:hypothetical protein
MESCMFEFVCTINGHPFGQGMYLTKDTIVLHVFAYIEYPQESLNMS